MTVSCENQTNIAITTALAKDAVEPTDKSWTVDKSYPLIQSQYGPLRLFWMLSAEYQYNLSPIMESL